MKQVRVNKLWNNKNKLSKKVAKKISKLSLSKVEIQECKIKIISHKMNSKTKINLKNPPKNNKWNNQFLFH